jgi:CDP-glycerol glycerophosphotransferase (TagB/SpsB family)
MSSRTRVLSFLQKNIIAHSVWSLLYFLRTFVRLVDFVWPKDNNLLVFSGQLGQKFSDNSKYLFQKFVKHYSDEFQIVWITCNKSLVKTINPNQSKDFQVVYQYSLAGIMTLLRAKVIFYVMGEVDIPYTAFSRRTVTIQLWHGIPIKRIGDGADSDSWRSSLARILKTSQYYSQYTYWISNSAIDRNTTALCVGLPMDRVAVTGYPRNDYLIEHKEMPSSELLVRFPYLQKKIILYAPTWRREDRIQFFPFDDFSFEDINAFLEVNDAYLLLRGHWNDEIYKRNGKIKYESFSTDRIITATHDIFEDVQELLPFVDILISDYSGIWIDYLLLDRPLIFVPYDLEEYEKEPGLMYNYYHITPGPKVSTNKEFIEAAQEYILNPEKDAEKRACIKKIFHEYEDGFSYRRIYELIKKCR